MPDIDSVVQYFSKTYLRRFKRLKPLTRKTYFSYISSFLRSFGPNFSEENIERFLRALPKTVRNKAFFALKHFAKHSGHEFNLTLHDFPEEFWYSEWDREYAERFSRDEIKRFCEAIKRGEYKRKQDAAALVLAIVWGLRKVEMVNMIPEKDIDLANKVFLVRTAKKGKKRLHLIPTKLLPYFAYLKKKKIRFTYLNNYNSFFTLSSIAGVPIKPRRAWHGFRRALVTDLLQTGIPDVEIYDFMRWSRREVIYKYYSPDPLEVDKKILEKHPYLPYLL
jgi:site-specific recombinase XerD